MAHEIHTISPVFDTHSKILILGSFPSVKSRESCFFYGHPQNRFWKVLSDLLKCPLPIDIMGKRELLLQNNIALWDVIESCDIEGSSDSSIKNVKPNDLNLVLSHSQVCQIYTNGTTSHKLYQKYCLTETGQQDVKLPSTSPANAAYSLERLKTEWRQIRDYLT